MIKALTRTCAFTCTGKGGGRAWKRTSIWASCQVGTASWNKDTRGRWRHYFQNVSRILRRVRFISERKRRTTWTEFPFTPLSIGERSYFDSTRRPKSGRREEQVTSDFLNTRLKARYVLSWGETRHSRFAQITTVSWLCCFFDFEKED